MLPALCTCCVSGYAQVCSNVQAGVLPFSVITCQYFVLHAGGGKDSEQGTHKCEMNSGEGNGKRLLDGNSCLENPLLDLQESEQTRRTTITTSFFFFFSRHCNPCGFWPAQLSLNILSRKVFTECRCQRHVKPLTCRTSD